MKYDVTPDAQRFIMIRNVGDSGDGGAGARLIMVQNFVEEIRGRGGLQVQSRP